MNKTFFVSILLIFMLASQGQAGFIGPSEVRSTTYGSGNDQVGLRQGDSGDEFPWKMAVSPTGRIALCDEANDRVVLYKPDGTFERSINILSTGVVFDSSDALYLKAKFRKFNKDGTMAFEKDAGYHEIFSTDNSIIGYDRDKKTYPLYSPTGQLIKTYTERPLELGRVKSSNRQTDGSVQTVIEYNDAIYSIKSPKMLESFTRDVLGNLCGVIKTGLGGNMHYRVYKYNKCGKVLGSIDLPQNNIVVEPERVPPRPVPRVTILEEYGMPVIAPNGDVYTWKRTPDKYSILKWTWVDDPNVPTGPEPPTNLSLTPSINGLYLTWQASPNDPGCVTKYEIARATTSGGVFSTIDTVEKGVLKYNDTTAETGTTYYYKIRAMAGSDPSAYTAEVAGKR